MLPTGAVIDCVITLVGSDDLLDIEGFTRLALEQRTIPIDVTTQFNAELERAKRTLAVCVREVDAKKGADAPPLGSVSDWGRLPPETLQAVYLRYLELRELHDPLAGSVRLDDVQRAELLEAIAKKNTPLLRQCGLLRLIALLCSTDVRLVSSQTLRSLPGDSSPDSASATSE